MAALAPHLDVAFHALANATRRAVIERLLKGPATVAKLARPFRMALPSFMQHLDVLEDAGLVRSWKEGRSRTVEIVPEQLGRAEGWLNKQRATWEQRLNQFDAYVKTIEEYR